MAKKKAAAETSRQPEAPPVEYASAMDKLRDEMAKSKDKYVQVVGEYLTDYLLAHPKAEAAHIARALDEALEYFPTERRHLALKYIGKHRDLTLGDIVDLWRMIEKAGGALTDADAFPKDFRQAHNRMIERVTAAANTAQDKKIAARAVKLEAQYGFEFGGLILRPAMSAAEVVREGQLLHHCVGSYVEKYASGATAIFVLRRAVQPDEPWRTVEISPKSGKVVQDRGLHNDWMNYEIDDTYRAMLAMFWEAWNERKKTNRGRKSA